MTEIARFEFQDGDRWWAVATFEGRVGVSQCALTKEEAIERRERDIDSLAYRHALTYIKELFRL